MKIIAIIFFATFFQAHAIDTFAQKINIKEKNVRLTSLLKQIRAQSGYDFLYNQDLIDDVTVTNIDLKDVSVEQAMQKCLQGLHLTFVINNKLIVIKKSAEPQTAELPAAKKDTLINGIVTDSLTNSSLPGVTVKIVGTNIATSTTDQGTFRIRAESGAVLQFSFIGYKTKILTIRSGERLLIKMGETQSTLKDIVITGQGSRDKTTYTGATVSFSGEELKAVNNQSLIKSISTLDPSLAIIQNNAAGSNPNVTPTVQLRGQTSLPINSALGQLNTDPNQPLFILDGFESSLTVINNLNMNMIDRIQILKDAAATAIYGPQGSNGVVVVETKKPIAGKVNVYYTTDLNVQAPDLSSYNRMNASELLLFQKLSGYYNENSATATTNIGTSATRQILQDSIYNFRLAEVNRGVNTYWLSKPLQTGFSQRHSLSVRGGVETIKFTIDGSYRNTKGVMIGNARNDYNAAATIVYRKGVFNFSNQASIIGFTSAESPYGSFSNWAQAAPYFRPLDASQPYLATYTSADATSIPIQIPNPLYNASLLSFNQSKQYQVYNNLQLNADLSPYLRLQLQGQLQTAQSQTDGFTSPLNTAYLNITDQTLKGQLVNTRASQLIYDINSSLNYARTIAKSTLNINLREQVKNTSSIGNGYVATGFPNASNGNPAFAYGYLSGSSPTQTNTVSRLFASIASLVYSYDKRYALNVNYNVTGTSVFGSEHLFQPYYSAGLAWTISNEKFLAANSWLTYLKLRATTGITGNQNFNNVSQTVYTYYPGINSSGSGIYISTFGAPGLNQQKTRTNNLGLDGNILNKRISFFIDVYDKLTDPLVVPLTLPSSTSLVNYPFNAGALTDRGIEFSLKVSPVYHPEKSIDWSVTVNGSSHTTKFSKLDNKLGGINSTLASSNSLTRYRDGYSPNDIWAVKSLGIDPATGREVFLKKNGQQTFTYDATDQVVVGNTLPKVQGTIGTSLLYKDFTASVFLNYVFNQDYFNTALYNKVENISYSSLGYNQDRRALYDRWQTPGDMAQFKAVSITSVTPISSRFVQKANTISGNSVSLGYRFNHKKWLSKAAIQSLGITLYSYDFFYASTIRAERGIDFPYARSFSMSLDVTF